MTDADHLPAFLADKLAKCQRGPREAALLRGTSQRTELCEPAAPLQDSVWFAEIAQLDIRDTGYLADVHSRPQQVTKYMPLYYRHAIRHRQGDDPEMEDKLQELLQQTLAMQNQWEAQQAAIQAYARRPVKAGIPFARPDVIHPKLVGAASIVPNNMLRHKWKPVKEPDLTRNPSGLRVLHVPDQTGNSLPDREGVRRRPPVAKLHCKAFQFPVLVSTQNEKPNRKVAPKGVERHRDHQMLGSGFRVRRGKLQFDLLQAGRLNND